MWAVRRACIFLSNPRPSPLILLEPQIDHAGGARFRISRNGRASAPLESGPDHPREPPHRAPDAAALPVGKARQGEARQGDPARRRRRRRRGEGRPEDGSAASQPSTPPEKNWNLCGKTLDSETWRECGRAGRCDTGRREHSAAWQPAARPLPLDLPPTGSISSATGSDSRDRFPSRCLGPAGRPSGTGPPSRKHGGGGDRDRSQPPAPTVTPVFRRIGPALPVAPSRRTAQSAPSARPCARPPRCRPAESESRGRTVQRGPAAALLPRAPPFTPPTAASSS